jgi:hypothetical protein
METNTHDNRKPDETRKVIFAIVRWEFSWIAAELPCTAPGLWRVGKLFGVVICLVFLSAAQAAEQSFTLDDLVKVLCKPDQKNDKSILYNGKLKATETKDGIDIAFNTGNEGLLFAAGLFTSTLFTKIEGNCLPGPWNRYEPAVGC